MLSMLKHETLFVVSSSSN